MKNRRITALFAVLMLVIVATQLSNIWRLETYPFTDLPNHLAEAYLIRALANPADALNAYYRVAITPFTPNSLHALFSAQFSDVETGSRVFYSLYILLWFTGIALAIRYGKGELWAALLASLFLWNYSVMWGFVGYMMGIALLVLDVVLLSRFVETPTGWRALSLAALTLLVFYAHAQAFLLAVALNALTVLTRRGFRLKHYFLGLATLIPGMVVAGLWIALSPSFSQEESTLSFLLSYYRHDYLGTLPGRLVRLPGNDNFRLAAGIWGGILGSLFALSIIIVVALSGAAAVRRWQQSDNRREAMRRALKRWTLFAAPASETVAQTTAIRHTTLIFLLVSLVTYFILPDDLPHHNAVFVRISVLILLGIIMIAGFLVRESSRKPFRSFVAVVVIVHAVLWAGYFSRFDAAAQPFHDLMWHSPQAQGKTLTAVIDADPASLYWRAFAHFQSYQLIWNHGAVPSKMIEQRFPLIQAQRALKLPHYREWVYRDTDYSQLLAEYRDMELLLVHGPVSLSAVQSHGGYAAIDRREDWVLFEKSGQ